MRTGLIAKKLGMTRVFRDDGTHVPVTLLGIEKNYVTGIKNNDVNNYQQLQVAEEKLKTKIVLIKDNNIAPPFFILKTNEPNKNKSSVIYDDVPKLLSEEEINKNKKNKKIEKKAIIKNKKKVETKKKIVKKKESIDEVSTLVK